MRINKRARQHDVWERFVRLRRQKRVQTAFTLGLVFLGPVLVVITFLIMGPFDHIATSMGLQLILLVDFAYILVVATLVMSRVAQLISDRRSQSAGSRLHIRLSAVFAGVALVPTILVAAFAVISVNLGLEGWFSDRVRSVVGSSLSAAQAYEAEHRDGIEQDSRALAAFMNRAKLQNPRQHDNEFRATLAHGQEAIQRGLKEAFLIDSKGELKSRGDRSYLFGFDPVSPQQIERALAGELVLIEDWTNNELRALIHLSAYADRFLYVSREVDGNMLSLLDETQETVLLYNQLESERGKVLLNFGLLYLGFAIIMILASIWMGLWFAERLSKPVGRLAGAAQRVGAGDLDVQIPEEEGDDEIAMMGRLFNRMTRQLKVQRVALIESHAKTEESRRLIESLLSNINAGIIGMTAEGTVDFVNRAGSRQLDLRDDPHDKTLAQIAPEFLHLYARVQQDKSVTFATDEVKLTRRGQLQSLLVRLSERRSEEGKLEGYVLAFDDVTDLVSAQRMAAWGDVARRIAHEIKNPLTPIALSAERIKRKFRTQVHDEEALEQLTDVIVRQTNDLRRIVDEFSKFARMPEPDRRETDLVAILRDALTLQEAGQPEVSFTSDIPEGPILMELDATMITQALTNLIKNAGEAAESFIEKGAPAGYRPEIRLRMVVSEHESLIQIMDNGIGLPEDRARLFEPYVTTRDKGTGLGLPIVKKIIEEHGGTLALLDAPVFEGNSHVGAMAEIRLPHLHRRRLGRNLAPKAPEETTQAADFQQREEP